MTLTNFVLTCTANTGNVLTWDISGTIPEGSYVEIYSGPAGGPHTLLATVNNVVASGNSYTHNDLETLCGNDTDYYLELYDNLAVLQNTSATLNCTNPCTPPASPSDFEIDCVNATSSSISMTWTALPATGINAFLTINIYRSTTDPALGGSLVLIANLPIGSSSYVDNVLTPGDEYWYSISYTSSLTSVETTAVTDGPCTIPLNTCQSNIPLTEYVFGIDTSCDDDSICITGVVNSSGNYIIPTELTCYSISSVTSISVKVWEKCCGTKPSEGEVIDGTSTKFVSQDSCFKWSGLSDGVYSVEMTVTYVDNDMLTKTVTTTKCAFLGCDLKCDVSAYIAKNPEVNVEAGIVYDAVGNAAECDNCQIACDLLEYLRLLVQDACNC